MKRIIYLLLLFPFICFGQFPQGVNYQAVAYDANGFELSNKEVGVRISIVEGSAFGTPHLVEEHDVTTSEQGLFSIIIGQGALLGGEVESLLDIPWGSNTFFLKIELDIENNGSYMDFGTQQFMSVPYALYAESSGTTGPEGPQGVFGLDGNSVIWQHVDNDGRAAPDSGGFTTLVNYDSGPPATGDKQLIKEQVTFISINYNNYPTSPTQALESRDWVQDINIGDVICIRNRDETRWPNDFATYTIIGSINETFLNFKVFPVSFIDGGSYNEFIDRDQYSIGYVRSGPQGEQGIQGEQGPIGETGEQGPPGEPADPVDYDSLVNELILDSVFKADFGGSSAINKYGAILPDWIYNTGFCSDNLPSVFQIDNSFISNGISTLTDGMYDYCNFTLNEGDILEIYGNVILRVSDTIIINGTIDGKGKSYNDGTAAQGGRGGSGSFNLNTIWGYMGNCYSASSYNSSDANLSYQLILDQNTGLSGSHGGSGNFISFQTNEAPCGNSSFGGSGLVIICKNLVFNGEIDLSGNDGSNSYGRLQGGGGGGAGGSIIISAEYIVENNGNINTSGGLGEPGGSGMSDGGYYIEYENGQDGGNGFILYFND